MLRADPTASRLLRECGTPMPDVGVSGEEARAIYEFLRGGAAP